MAYNIDNETIMQVWNDLKKKKLVQGNCKTLCVFFFFCFWSISNFFIIIKFCIMGKNRSAIKGEHYEVLVWRDRNKDWDD